MSWKIVYRSALRDWREPDVEVRRALLQWLESLAVDGPPLLSEVDEDHGFLRTIAPTGTVVAYFVDHDQRLIAIVSLRS